MIKVKFNLHLENTDKGVVDSFVINLTKAEYKLISIMKPGVVYKNDELFSLGVNLSWNITSLINLSPYISIYKDGPTLYTLNKLGEHIYKMLISMNQ